MAAPVSAGALREDRIQPARAGRRRRAGFVPRPRLVRRLIEEEEATTVLISAPAGYGKTSLLSEWAQYDPRPFGWVEPCQGHNAAGRLIASLARAMHGVEPLERSLVEGAEALGGDGRAAMREELLGELTAVVASMGGNRAPAVLVLDGLDVRSRESQRVVAALAAAMPPAGKLALAARTLPGIPLGRMRVEGSLLELRSDDLAMNSYEAHRLLGGAGLELGRADLDRLLALTEGWPAGLYLAALSLRSRAQLPVALESFAADDPRVRDYVEEEVLAPLDAEQREFLLCASILPALSAERCDAALARTDSAAMLRALSGRNLIAAPVGSDPPLARCNPLLREVLQAELAGRGVQLAELHRRASQWFAAQGQLEPAVSHAAACGDTEIAGELIWANAVSEAQQAGGAELARRLAGFSDEQLAGCASLALSAAHCQLAAGRLEPAARWGRAASAALQRQASAAPDRSLAAGLAVIDAAAGSGGLAAMNAQALRACELVDDASPWRAAGCLLQGVFRHLSGDRTVARGLLGESVHRSAMSLPQTELVAIAQLTLMDAEDGDWERAQDRVETARRRMAANGLARHPTSALMLAVAAWVAAQEGNAEQAKRDLGCSTAQLAELGEFIPWYMVETRVTLARVAIGLGDVERARVLLSQASRVARSIEDCPVFHRWLDDAWGAIDDLSAVALTGPRSLTMAELRILRFLPTHLSFREIGERLHVSTNTVKSQAHSIYGKLGTSSRSEAVARAAGLGLISVAVI